MPSENMHPNMRETDRVLVLRDMIQFNPAQPWDSLIQHLDDIQTELMTADMHHAMDQRTGANNAHLINEAVNAALLKVNLLLCGCMMAADAQ